jgi:hypothetical protein
MSVLIGMTLFAFGFLPTWVCALIGGTAYAVPKEIKDISKQKGRIVVDNVSDLVSYQLIWPVAYAADHEPLTAAILLAVVAAAYLGLVYVKTKGKM